VWQRDIKKNPSRMVMAATVSAMAASMVIVVIIGVKVSLALKRSPK